MEKTMNQTTSPASEELKPCPFCGGNFKIAQEPHDNGYVSGLWYVYHDYGPLGSKARSCPFSFERHFNSKQDAINACNTRTSPQAESVPPMDGNVFAIAPILTCGPCVLSSKAEWQDISTAPKDGTYMLVYQTDVLAPDIIVCSFDPDWSDDGWWMCCDGKNPELPLRGPAPTHWQPLPQPPIAGGE